MAEGYFSAGDLNDPRVNQALRQRIAAALIAKKGGYPKNIGEGLSAIGEALGDRGLAKMLEQSDIAAQGVQPPPPAETTRDIYKSSDALGGGDLGDEPAVANIPEGAKDVPARSIEIASLPPPTAAMPPPPPAAAVLATPAPRMQPGQVTTNVSMPQQNQILKDPAAVGGRDVGTVPPTALSVAQGYMDPAAASSLGVGSVNQAMGQSAAPAGTTDAMRMQGRAQLAQAMLAQQQQPTAPAVPQPNPTLAGAAQLPSSSTIPSPEDLKPDQRLAQDTSRSMSDIGAAPQVPQIRSAPPPGPPQPQAVPGYVPPEPGQVPGAPLVGMSPREIQLQQWLAANQGNPYAAMKVAAELQDLQAKRTTRQNEANERFKAAITLQTKQAEMRQQGLMDQAKRIQDYTKGQQELITGGVPGVPPAGQDPRIGTPQSPQRTGIPVAPPVPPGLSPAQWSETQKPEMAKAVAAVEKATPQFNEMVKAIRLARDHPGREWGLGATGQLAQRTPGTSAYAFGQLMEQIGGKNFLNAYTDLRGSGQISNIEGEKATAAQARLSTAQNKEDFDKALNDFESTIRQSMETVQRKVNQPVTAWQHTPNDQYAPDVGQVDTRPGKPGVWQYIGGNPALDQSFRRLR